MDYASLAFCGNACHFLFFASIRMSNYVNKTAQKRLWCARRINVSYVSVVMRASFIAAICRLCAHLKLNLPKSILIEIAQMNSVCTLHFKRFSRFLIANQQHIHTLMHLWPESFMALSLVTRRKLFCGRSLKITETQKFVIVIIWLVLLLLLAGGWCFYGHYGALLWFRMFCLAAFK